MQAKTDNHRLLFETELENMIDLEHPLVKLAQQIDWSNFEREFGVLYDEGKWRPAKPIRLMVGLQYLKYTFNFSDEQLVYAWIENPYWQYFCGEKYFQHQLPIDPTSMTKWRNRVKDSGLETLLEETIKAGLEMKVIKKADTQKLVVDTTVQEKNITFPTDAKLCFKAREKLVDLASNLGIKLRQTYRRLANRLWLCKAVMRNQGSLAKPKKNKRSLKTFLAELYVTLKIKLETISCYGLSFQSCLTLLKISILKLKTARTKLTVFMSLMMYNVLLKAKLTRDMSLAARPVL
jgi:transposase, IS5 family